jgi:hypothetical protein
MPFFAETGQKLPKGRLLALPEAKHPGRKKRSCLSVAEATGIPEEGQRFRTKRTRELWQICHMR